VRLLRHGTSPQILSKTADRPGFHPPTAETSRQDRRQLSGVQVQVNLKSSAEYASHQSMEPELSIQAISRRSGVASSALRFYEERGLIASQRARSGHRRYPRAVLRRIAFIVFAQRIGLSLEEIGTELAKLPADRTPTRTDWARMSGGWTKRIDQKIAELQRLREGLTQCIGCGCLSIDKCQFANPADRAGKRGSGPRYWLK
jgi:MerR family transcriptional regulator, redox-sensitive transcriptional activator SoxR